MQKIIITSLLLIIGIVGAIIMSHIDFSNRNLCLNANTEQNILICSHNPALSAQEQYDLIYNNFNKYNSDMFYMRFIETINDCLTAQQKNHDCHLKNVDTRLLINIQNCVKNGGDRCSTDFFSHAEMNQANTLLFNEMIEKKNNCFDNIQIFNKISEKERKNLSLRTIENCKKN